MAEYLHIAVTFLDARFHGTEDGGKLEWPPSPLRLFQAIVAANAAELGSDGALDRGLTWLEQQEPPLVIAPNCRVSAPYCLSVPNNSMDIVARAWSRGNYFGSGDANPATHRTMKSIRPVHIADDSTVHFAWRLPNASHDQAVVPSLIKAARRIVSLGWGVDLAVADADLISSVRLQSLRGERWLATSTLSAQALRTPTLGTLAALKERHGAFLRRLEGGVLSPVGPLRCFERTAYRRPTDPHPHPHAIFELRHDDGTFCAYSQRRLIHLAGMVRHLAKETMQKFPPAGVDRDWVERYVVGHRDENTREHRQLSYLPLPSIGHPYADQAVRRVMIAAPSCDDFHIEHLARRLNGLQLRPEVGNEFGVKGPPTLIRVERDNIARHYTAPANQWASVTPVILPGHDDRKPAKTRRLIETALVQSGIEQPCTYEWSAFSHFRNSLSAHKYDRDRRPTGYFRPNHLLSQTAVHVTLTFNDDVAVQGPLAIGAGRHCGLGVLAHRNWC